MFNGGLGKGSRPGFSVRVKWMTAFHHTPTVILAFSNKVCLLPQVLSVLTNPELICCVIISDAPWCPQSIGPCFADKILVANKGIVLRYGIHFARFWMIDIDAQYLGQKRVGTLPHQVAIGIGCAVSTGDKHQSVAPEANSSTVMSIRGPSNNGGVGCRINHKRRLGGHGVAGNGAMLPIFPGDLAIPAEVNETVMFPVWMESDVVGGATTGRIEEFHSRSGVFYALSA